jgi:hypothetical protein
LPPSENSIAVSDEDDDDDDNNNNDNNNNNFVSRVNKMLVQM